MKKILPFFFLSFIILFSGCEAAFTVDEAGITEQLLGEWKFTRIVSPTRDETISDITYTFNNGGELLISNNSNTYTTSYEVRGHRLEMTGDFYQVLQLNSSEMIVLIGEERGYYER